MPNRGQSRGGLQGSQEDLAFVITSPKHLGVTGKVMWAPKCQPQAQPPLWAADPRASLLLLVSTVKHINSPGASQTPNPPQTCPPRGSAALSQRLGPGIAVTLGSFVEGTRTSTRTRT